MKAVVVPAQAARSQRLPAVKWGSDLRALFAQPGTRTVVLDGSRDPNSGVTVLLMPATADRPELAVKLATTSAAASVIAREARLLNALQHRPMGKVERTLPRLAGLLHADGMLAIATTALPGVPMRTPYHAFRHLRREEAVRADFAAAASWLADLHAATATANKRVGLLTGVPARMNSRWPDDAQARELAGRLEAVASRLGSASTPRTVVHGDFWAGNVLVTGATVSGVVDWPAARLAGEPLADVARFALSYALYLDRHTRPGRRVAGHRGLRADAWGAGIRYAIAGQHWFGEVVRDFVTSALSRLGARTDLWRDVLLAGLAEIAVSADEPAFAARHRALLACLISEVEL